MIRAALELERTALATLLFTPEVTSSCPYRFTSEDFSDVANKIIFEAAEYLKANDKQVAFFSLYSRINTLKKTSVVDVDYLKSLAIYADPSVDVLIDFKRSAVANKLSSICFQLYMSSKDGFNDGFEMLEKLYLQLQQVEGKKDLRKKNISIIDAINKAIEHAQDVVDGKGGHVVQTGFKWLDRQVGGHQAGELWTWAARPGMGKTLFMVMLAIAYANQGVPVDMICLEMNQVQVAKRFISMMSGVDPALFRNKKLTTKHIEILNQSKSIFEGMPINILYCESTEPAFVMSLINSSIESGVKGIMLDYLQRMAFETDRNGSTSDKIGKFVREVKTKTNAHGLFFNLFSQFSRTTESRSGKRPEMSDLAESGKIEAESDAIFGLYRPSKYGFEVDQDGNDISKLTEIMVLKFRDISTVKNGHMYYDDDTFKMIDKEDWELKKSDEQKQENIDAF